ncbi:MAG: 3-hydroxybutyryl-CoA dehydrogenase, partial [Chloroflexi bacterium]|nr:3-hydroxybutyryl-CoA dehydrogenase [Chloroflexota bacterium]
EAVTVNDTVGGVLPRVVANVINGAVFAVMEGVASPRDIDQAMKLGTNYPHGPLEWGDKIGLDQVLGIINALHEAHGERYRPAPLLVQMAQAKRKFYE